MVGRIDGAILPTIYKGVQLGLHFRYNWGFWRVSRGDSIWLKPASLKGPGIGSNPHKGKTHRILSPAQTHVKSIVLTNGKTLTSGSANWVSLGKTEGRADLSVYKMRNQAVGEGN